MAGALFLAACSNSSDYFESVNLAPPARVSDSCGATQFKYLVGQPVTALAGVAIPDPKRVIEAGSMVTKEYFAERINIRLDVENNIADVYCG